MEELFDILEVIYAIANVKGITLTEIEEKRVEKARKNGAFIQKVFLEKINIDE